MNKILRPIEQYRFREVENQENGIIYFEVYDRYTDEVVFQDESFAWCIHWIIEEEVGYETRPNSKDKEPKL
ncbi:hypothetical protein CH380_19580 [Leptospira adleri]|uniref:Uncharacterized protein n=1 Tax=Leptospira adleri TaxID=2023186 RepID=A0A2M9YJ02_9LEPT|nr:hypothetical protein CH380_19580 [Leptospira adleri]PJZ61602.1 hypothetical protein CH376_12505 [Leptospira adleri]